MAAPWGLGTGSFKQFCSLHVPSTWKVMSAARSTMQPGNAEKRMESMVPSSGSCTCHFGSRPISWRLVTWPHLAAREAGTSCWVGGSGPRSSSKSSVTKERRVQWTLRTAHNLHHGPPLGDSLVSMHPLPSVLCTHSAPSLGSSLNVPSRHRVQICLGSVGDTKSPRHQGT